MNIIKINAGISSTVSDITASSNDQTLKRSHMQDIKQKPVNQMNMLMNIVKMTPENPFHTQVIQSIKSQIQMDYYQVDMNSLVSHLFQELSVDGVV